MGNGNVLAHRQVVDAVSKAAEVNRDTWCGAVLMCLHFEDGVAVGLRGGDRDGEEQNDGDEDTGDTDPKDG